MEVPDLKLVAVSESATAASMDWPGAYKSTHDPKFEKLATQSPEFVAPTVMACGAEAGDERQASSASLPAATTTLTPAACAASTALFSACE